MMRIELPNDRVAYIHNWEDRHSNHPCVQEQIRIAQGGDAFLLMFRGQEKAPPRKENLFLIGQKARPAYHHGNIDRLRYNFRAIGDNESLFSEIADIFVKSPMHHEHPTIDKLMERYKAATPQQRMRLGQLLIYGLQYQNLRREVRQWRDYMFTISCTKEEAVAIKYALNRMPRVAYVFEYAPPAEGEWFVQVSEVIDEFRDLHLGHIYPDRESEIFLNYAMFPHYLLGYSILYKVSGESRTYEADYIPNPWYTEHGATLHNPPELNPEQERLIQETQQEFAWIYHCGDNWCGIRGPDGITDISVPDSDGG